MAIFVRYQYQIAGENDIKRSMTSVADHAERQGQRVARAQQRQRSGITGTGPGAANLNASAREAEAMYRAQENAAKKSELMRERSEKRTADKAVREHARSEREQTRATEKEARSRSQIEERWASKNRQLKEQHIRSLAAREVEEARIVQRSRASLANTLMRGAGNAARTVASVGRGALAVSGIGGTMLAANALHEGMKVESTASGMANQMAAEGESKEQIVARRKGIIASAEQIHGFSTYDAIQAARTFGGASGSYTGGQAITKDLAEISLATDVDLQDIAKLAGNTYNKFKTPEMSEAEAQKQTLQAVRIFAGQGNVGAVEIKDLAQYGTRLTAGAAKFEGTKLGNMARMGALAQVAAGPGEATDAAEATEAAMRFATDLSTNAGRIGKLSIGGKKISAFTDKSETQLRGIKEIIQDVIEATGGSLPQMGDIFGARSAKMTSAFQQQYLTAERENEALAPEKRQAKGKAGRAAIAAEFEKFDKAALSEKDQTSRAEAALSTSSAQVEEAMKKLNAQLAEELLPKLPPLIHAFSEAIPSITSFISGMAKVAEWAVSNPFAGFSALISAALLKELIAADISGAIKSAIFAMTGAGGVGGTGGAGVAAGAGGAVKGAGAAAGLGSGALTGVLAAGAAISYGNYKVSTEHGKAADELLRGGAITQEKVTAAGGDVTALANLDRKREQSKVEAALEQRGMITAGAPGDSAINSSGAGFAELFKMLFSKAATDQERAAKALETAATHLNTSSPAGARPGRGDAPTPVVR